MGNIKALLLFIYLEETLRYKLFSLMSYMLSTHHWYSLINNVMFLVAFRPTLKPKLKNILLNLSFTETGKLIVHWMFPISQNKRETKIKTILAIIDSWHTYVLSWVWKKLAKKTSLILTPTLLYIGVGLHARRSLIHDTRIFGNCSHRIIKNQCLADPGRFWASFR